MTTAKTATTTTPAAAPPTEAELRAELATARSEAKQLRTQLAGCLAAATGGLDPAKDILATDYGWSPAFEATRRLRQSAEKLATILDDIDSASDRAQPSEGGKASIARYRELVEAELAKAREIVAAGGDGVVRWALIDGIEWGQPTG